MTLLSSLSSITHTLQQQLNITTNQKQEQIKKLHEVRKKITEQAEKVKLTTENMLSEKIFQYSLQQPRPEDPLDHFNWLLKLAQKVKQGELDITIHNHIQELQETMAVLEQLSEQCENKIQQLDKDNKSVEMLIEEQEKTLTLIQQLNSELIQKNQERQQ